MNDIANQLVTLDFYDESQEESPNLLEHFKKAVVTSRELQSLDLPKREPILGSWFLEGDLGFIYGPRGLGKTWLTMHMAKSISQGTNCGNWACNTPRPILYIDGEMPAVAMKERDHSLTRVDGDNFCHLNHEIYFERTGQILALSDPIQQQAILQLCIEMEIKVLFLDNISCLFSGLRENQADDWEQVLPWLLQLRRAKISVVFVHHSGRAGKEMRGTSRREDAAFWVIGLSNPIGEPQNNNGARFISRFTKDRNSPNKDETSPVEWTFEPSQSGKTSIICRKADDLDIFEQLLKEGLTNCSEIAQEMGCSPGKVSKMAAKGIKAGWLNKNGREYEYVV